MQPAWWAPLTAFTAALLTTWWLAKGRVSRIVVDTPNTRSLHDRPVPRTGGLGLQAGFLAGLAVIAPGLPDVLWIAYAALLLISFLDDLRNIAPAWRFAVHLGASGLFATNVLGGHGIWAVIVVVLWCAWMTNLYNFMDGSDGLAGGMAAIGFSFYGIAACFNAHIEFALVNFSIAAAALGFLVFNFYPARIFLGDSGSVPLGFLAAALGVLGWLQQDWSWWFPLLVFAPFVADASVTLARRLLKMEKIWQAHRDHYYQRLVRMGWGHRKTALAEYAVMAASGGAALVGLTLPADMQLIMLAAITLGYLMLTILIEIGWRRHPASKHA